MAKIIIKPQVLGVSWRRDGREVFRNRNQNIKHAFCASYVKNDFKKSLMDATAVAAPCRRGKILTSMLKA